MLARHRKLYGTALWPPGFEHPRDRHFYDAALRILGNDVHLLGLDPEDPGARTAFCRALAGSPVGAAWLAWAGVEDLGRLDPASAVAFLSSCADLAQSTARRRASTLRAWLEWCQGSDATPVPEAAVPSDVPRETKEAGPIPVVRTLLEALRAMGRESVAEAFEREFDARGWDRLGTEDQVRVLEELRPASSGSTATPVPDPPAEVPFPEFVDAVRGGRDLLARLDRLARSTTSEEALRAVRSLFVEGLGYSPQDVDLTDRVGQRSSIASLHAVAAHGAFEIGVAVLTDTFADTRWAGTSSHYATCFKLLPDALVVGIEPGTWAIRFVYRQRRGGELLLRYRALVGPLPLRDPNDTLVTWLRRIEWLRPQYGDDHLRLRERAEQALDADTAALAAGWASVEFTGEDVPGRRWHDRSQLLAEADDGVLHGLGWVLRQLFPARLAWQRYRLALCGWSRGADPPPADEAWRRGSTLAREIHLRLQATTWQGAKVAGSEFTLTGLLPVADDTGALVVRGRRLACAPRLENADHLRPLAEEDEDEEEDEQDARPDPASPLGGLSFDAWLLTAVERRLRQLLRAVSRYLPELVVDDPSSFGRAVHAAIVHALDERQRVELVPDGWLLARLPPAPEGPFEPWVEATTTPSALPAWSCPEASRIGPPGRLVPVAAARVHPCGGIAMPTLRGTSRFSLEVTTDRSACDVNPRLGGDGGGPSWWWVAPHLSPWSDTDGGSLRRADRLSAAMPLPAAVVVTCGDLAPGTAFVRPGLSVRRPVRRVAFDLPAWPGTDEQPALLVREGQRVGPGAAWLRIPPDLVRATPDPERSAIRRVLVELAAEAGTPCEQERARAVRRDKHVVHVPSDLAGTVVACGIEARRSARGFRIGWRAWLEIAPSGEIGWLVDAQGHWYRVTDRPDGSVWSADGEAPDVVLGSPEPIEPDGPWFSEATGELAPAATTATRLWAVDVTLARRDPAWQREDRQPLPGEPELSRSAWWSFAAQAPSSATEIVLRQDAAPLLERCALALLAGRVTPPTGLFPEPWGRLPTPIDVRDDARLVPTEHRLDTFVPTHAWRWSGGEELVRVECACGAWSGLDGLGRPCEACGDPVRPRPGAVDRWPVLRLPTPVLHPWRKEVAAAALGLLRSELDELVGAWGPRQIAALLREHWNPGAPLEAARRRLALPPAARRALQGSARAAFGRAVRALGEQCAADPLLADLWLDALPVPPPALLRGGAALGVPDPFLSPLWTSLQRVRAALRLERKLRRESEVLERQRLVTLQRAIDGYLGDPDAGSGLHTIAGLVRREWPLRAGSEALPLVGLVGMPLEPVADPEACEDRVHRLTLAPPPFRSRPSPAPAPARAAPPASPELRWTMRVANLTDHDAERRAFEEVVWQAHEHRRETWLRDLSLPVAHRKTADVKRLLRDASFARVLDVTDLSGLRWVYRLVTGEDPPARCDADELRHRIRAGGSRRETLVPRAVVVHRPAVPPPPPPPVLEPLDPGQIWARPAPLPRMRVGVLVGERFVEIRSGGEAGLASRGAWQRTRAARSIEHHFWPWLAAAVVEAAYRCPPPGRSAGQELAETALAGLAQAVRARRSGIVPLLEALERRRPVPLPRDREEARTTCWERLAVLAALGAAPRIFVEVWSEAATGWALGEVLADLPSGGRWIGDAAPSDGLRRAIPPPGHAVWSEWTSVRAVEEPIGFAVAHPQWKPPAALMRLLALPTEAAIVPDLPDLDPEPADATSDRSRAMDAEPATIPDAPDEPLPVDDFEPPLEVAVAATSLADWLGRRPGGEG